MDDSDDEKPGLSDAPAIVWVIAMLFVGVEIAFYLTRAEILPWPDLIEQAVTRFAVFDHIFEDMISYGTGSPSDWLRVITHAFIHAGTIHVAMTTVIFLALGGIVAKVLGTLRFMLLIIAVLIGSALTFTLIQSTTFPLIGAYGLVFGLFGALKRWEWRFMQLTDYPLQRFAGSIGALAFMTLIVGILMPHGGPISWSANIGGFITGFVAAAIIAPNVAGPSPI